MPEHIVLEEREWILKRPTIYLGPTTVNEHEFYLPQTKTFEKVSYIPALQKLFDEVLENSIDEFIRTKGKYANKISVTVTDEGMVTISDNGRGLPIEKHHQFPDLYTPQVLFTKLRSGSNFKEEREGIGVNGVGVSLVVLFSKTFILETFNNNKSYKQVFENMLTIEGEPKVKSTTSDATGTTISFLPNFSFFNAHNWCFNMISKRVYDLAYMYPEISFKLNSDKIKGIKKRDYITVTDFEVAESEKTSIIITKGNESDLKFAAFVNGANTFEGGWQVEYPIQVITNYLRPKLEKKYKIELKPKDIRDHLNLFIWLKMTNPQFSSQTKEKIINTQLEVKPYFDEILTESFLQKIFKNDTIVNKIIEEALAKKEIAEKIKAREQGKKIAKKKVFKLSEANSKDREKCILFLCEGDSALSNSTTVRDTKHHAFLPLRGKVLNVYSETTSKVLSNSEIQDMINAIGLDVHEKESENLRYGKIVLLSDQDPDGAAIASLLINFFYKFWPSLFDKGIICRMETPLYIAKKGNEKIYIYNQKDMDEMKNKLDGYKVKYFKGLAGLSEDDWDHFLNREPRMISLTKTEASSNMLKITFGPDSNLRKEWLS